MAGGKGQAASDFGRLLLRLIVGLSLMTHGFPKLFGHTAEGGPRMTRFIQTVTEMGLPYPVYLAWAAALSEFAGAGMLALGLLTRLAGFFIAATMAVALYKNRGGSFGDMELALMYLGPALFFLLSGPGRYSADASLFKRKAASKN